MVKSSQLELAKYRQIHDPGSRCDLGFFFLLKCEEKLVRGHFLECFYLFGSKYSHSNFFTYHSTASSCRLAGCSSHYSLAGSASENFPRDNMVEELGFNSKQRTFSMVRSVRQFLMARTFLRLCVQFIEDRARGARLTFLSRRTKPRKQFILYHFSCK